MTTTIGGTRVSLPRAEAVRTEPPGGRLDRLGRGLMGLNAVLTLGALVTGVIAMVGADDDRLMVEGWRTFGYLMFVCAWTALALWPRRLPAVWELVLLQKTLVTIYAFAILGAPEATAAAVIDSWLVVTTVFAYVVCRGWHSWRLVGERS